MNKNLLVGLIFFMVVTTLFFMRRTRTISKRHSIDKLSKLSKGLIRDKLQINTAEQDARRASGLEDTIHASMRDDIDIFKDKIEEKVDIVEEIDRKKEEVYTGLESTVEKVEGILSRNSLNSENLWLNVMDNPNLPDNGRVFESAEERLEYRRSWLRSVCHIMRRQGYTPPNMKMFASQYKEHFIVNHEKKILYCYLPKVANTNFRRVFLGLQGVVPKNRIPYISGYNVYFVHDDKFTYLKSFTAKEQHDMLNTYRKFMVVRDPFERLLSGYRNKFFHPNPEHTAEFLRKVTSFYKIRPSLLKREGIKVRTSNFEVKPLTYEEFLVYFVDTYEVGAFLNEHFTASNQLCDPCKTKIDYIAKYDTLFDDVQHIFDKLNIDIEFPGRNDNYYAKETRSIESIYYEKIPKWLLMKVWHILKYDYALFGFSIPEWFRERMNQ